jgi:hypothetical protein
LKPMVFFLFLLALVPELLAAQHEIPDRLRQLLQNTPPLAVDRIELTVDPTVKLEGISAVTADQQGNIYVIHRPSSGDPIIVLDRQGKLIRSWGDGMFKIPHGRTTIGNMKPTRHNPQLAGSRLRNMRLDHSLGGSSDSGLDARRTASPHRGARESFSLDIPSHRMT